MTLATPFKKTSLHELVIVLALISACGLQLQHFADDPGVGWHLGTGKWVIEHGAIPLRDPFLGGGILRSWISDQWLADVIFYGLFSLGSWPLLYAVLTIFFLSTYLGVLYGGLRRMGVPALAATFAAMVSFKAGQIHFILRPVMISFLCFSLVYLHCLAQERDREHRTRLAYLGLFALLFVLWANMHPGFVLGLVLLAILFGIRVARACCGGSEWAQVGHDFLFLAVGSVATCVNPYGLELHRSIIALQQSDYFMNLHEEWLPVRLGTPEGELCAFIIFLLLAGLSLGRGSRRIGTPFAVLVSLLFAYACFDAVRMVPFFGIAASYPVACALASIGRHEIFQRSRVFVRLHSAFGYFEQHEQQSRWGFSLLAAMTIGLLVASVTSNSLVLFSGPFGPRADKYPYVGVTKLLEQGTQSGKSSWTVVSGAEWGGFLTQFGLGKLKPLIDDRNTLVGEEFYREYEERIERAVEWSAYLDARDVDAVLLPPTRLLSHAIRGDSMGRWNIVYQDALQTVAVRRSASR